ncbi:MAG: peptidylprolyl isomerase [Sphingomicrobium sp.]
MRSLILIALLAGAAAPAPPKKLTPTDIIDAAPPSAWREIPADDLMVMMLDGGGKVVIQLAPAFAPVHVENIRRMASGGYWKGAAVYRVQDNYVAQWGINEEKRALPAGAVALPPHEYWRSTKGLAVTPFPYRDSYAPRTGFALGWPVALRNDGTANLTHCYGYVGVARDLAPDTGTGGELYAIIGHAPRGLDRNIAVVGRVISGIENLSALPRGGETMGFYKAGSVAKPIVSVAMASSLPADQRPRFKYLSESSPAFAAALRLRANRNDDFFKVPAGGIDLCAAGVPVRPIK